MKIIKDKAMIIYCCECKKEVKADHVSGEMIYPHRADLHDKKFLQCPECKNYVGRHADGRPLGTIPSPEIRKARIAVHSILDPMWKDGGYSRESLYKLLSAYFGLKEYHTGEINSVEFGNEVIEVLKRLNQ